MEFKFSSVSVHATALAFALFPNEGIELVTVNWTLDWIFFKLSVFAPTPI